MKLLPAFLFAFAFATNALSQDTFSIVAVDSLTGEIGSAGASCLDNLQFPGSNGAIIISNILPGRGAIHTQAQWNATNQNTARAKMLEGLAPAAVVDWMKTHDAGFSANTRQYGVVDFSPAGNPRSAAFTGTNCLDWKGHRTGPNYSIQGNILLGPQILDSMEAHFLAATGTLADRLMYALQGAKVVGADTRCTANGTSSLSAFVRVAKPSDPANQFYLDLNVPSLPAKMEPIDSLQRLYDQWKTSAAPEPAAAVAKVFPNPTFDQISVVLEHAKGVFELYDSTGRLVFSKDIAPGMNILSPEGLIPGLLLAKITANGKLVLIEKLMWLRP